MSKRPKTTASIQHLAGTEEIEGTMTTNGTAVIGAPTQKRRAVAKRQAAQTTQRVKSSVPLGERTTPLAPIAPQAPKREKLAKNPKPPKAAKVKHHRRSSSRRPSVGHSMLDFLPRLTGAPFVISVHVLAIAGAVYYFVLA